MDWDQFFASQEQLAMNQVEESDDTDNLVTAIENTQDMLDRLFQALERSTK